MTARRAWMTFIPAESGVSLLCRQARVASCRGCAIMGTLCISPILPLLILTYLICAPPWRWRSRY